MSQIEERGHSERLKLARFVMVLSSLSPLFFLWAIKGMCLIPDKWFVTGCLVIAILPTGFLLFREWTARKRNDTRELIVGQVEDHRGHVLVYLFAILLPFYRQNVENWRDFSALLAALVLIVFLFWHLNYHYMNVFFAIRGYRVLNILSPEQSDENRGMPNFSLITRRHTVRPSERVLVYRLSNTVYMEKST